MSNKSDITIAEHIAKTVTNSCNNKIVFSDPVEKDGVIVIPVAKVGYGLGGGNSKNHNEGGGGGFLARPVGFIKIKNGEATFKAIREPSAYVPFVMVGGIAVSLCLRALRRLLRA